MNADDPETAGSDFAVTLALGNEPKLSRELPREALIWLREVVSQKHPGSLRVMSTR
jgi:hypothetical protein